MNLIVNPAFKNLLPPLSPEEYNTLAESIVAEGCRENIIVWRGQIVDGHNRYEICTEHKIRFGVCEKEFESEMAVMDWIDKNQIARRNLSPDDFRLAVGRRYNRTKKSKADAGAIGGASTGQNVRCLPTTAQTIARESGVDERTVRRAGKLAEAVETVEQAEPELAEHGREAVITRAKETLKPHVANNSGDNEWYTPKPYIDAARAVMGNIDIDPASSDEANKIVQASKIYTAEDSGLKHDWAKITWINPSLCSCGIQPSVIDWGHEIETMSRLRNALPCKKGVHGVSSSAIHSSNKDVLSMFNEVAKHFSAFSGKVRKGEMVFRLLQAVLPRECETEAGGAAGRPDGKGKTAGREEAVQPKRKGAGGETGTDNGGQPHQAHAKNEGMVRLERGTVEAVPSGVGSQMRVLWSGGRIDSGSFYSALTSSLSGDGARKHGARVLEVQLEKGPHASSGLAGQASVCPRCGSVGVAIAEPSRVFLNPPYETALVGKFIEKLATSVESGGVTEAIVLVNNATETRWFARLAGVSSCACFPTGRVRFWKPGKEKAAPLQGQCVCYVGANPDAFMKEFRQFGIIVRVVK